ncbi:inositol monophosphatase [Marivirga sp. S37H4]|uniref:Inositol-1-monophosphatase n=1 Tax=Marivirga aurantiaca TaxID=2802615 RepID=A0A935C9E5_9BACT|nr:inositol monophosphatase family protein [Marivirga aurantiaca]MBK6265542.1 inositol monophosphatase [Marivirga aurantiaca]
MDLAIVQTEAIELVKEVGAFIRKEAEGFQLDKVEKKGFNDLVSYVDKQAEIKLVEGLSKILPEAGFIAEEGTSDKTGEEYNWIIDPVDGTTNFVHGLPIYSISVALQKNETTIAGIVYEINRDECFHAIEGEKGYLNHHPIHVSKNIVLAESLIATGFPYYDFDKMSVYFTILQDLMQNSHGIRRLGSAAVDLAYVACGRFEGFFEYNLNSWDVAAGAFIVQQAGGKVSTFSGGNDFNFGREIIAASPKVHEEMLHSIQKRWKQ